MIIDINEYVKEEGETIGFADDILGCTSDKDLDKALEKAQIQVESPHPIFGSQPHAEQFGQCGVAGEQLTLPYTLLTDNVRVTQQNSKSNYYIKIKFYFPHFLYLDLGKCFML